jgi:hypothetical protein
VPERRPVPQFQVPGIRPFVKTENRGHQRHENDQDDKNERNLRHVIFSKFNPPTHFLTILN